jgi:hypothetical protein
MLLHCMHAHTLHSEHTHVGIGLCVIEGRLRYTEVYVARHVTLEGLPAAMSTTNNSSSSSNTVLRGHMLKEGAGPLACVVHRDALPWQLSSDDVAERFPQHVHDFRDEQVCATVNNSQMQTVALKRL